MRNTVVFSLLFGPFPHFGAKVRAEVILGEMVGGDLAIRETEPLGGLPVQRRGACVGSGEGGRLWEKYTVERLLRTPPTPT